MLPVLVIASRQPQFFNFYPMQYRAGEDWTFFFYHQLTYGLYFFCWEFFYRGFLTFGLSRSLGFRAAIVLQSIGFGIMHVGKPMPEVYACFVLHWAISATFDILTIYARPGGIF